MIAFSLRTIRFCNELLCDNGTQQTGTRLGFLKSTPRNASSPSASASEGAGSAASEDARVCRRRRRYVRSQGYELRHGRLN